MDTIFIQDLLLRGKHGVYDEERTREQEFVLDIAVDFDTHKAAVSDDINDTANYAIFRKVAKEVVEGPSFKLLEKLADVVATKILEDTRIGRVVVTVRKTEMYKDCTPGVTVVRSR
ncbi:dihydroneopterin aldolase [Candidatus Kaiserbacteria bacterium RIFCSPHIGHO2_02_FULL_55_25]|uniref:7,8-dihydroneopterin aldolase n=1 Tax=Candidatus Kaiserbacteria bacterium RIFCSPHIGHO2_02_FULL_55_25 TaxID=1798498 RepID=A0A1F6EB13_9BACT|nr:MAG: dihydroneopterin aldolase [Candidatus Kaiserbacteria bacterium RIFCSPHIGHO2_01_FULL_55_79]OGG70791.1 MAG: dihydroneopterin aldolase [Candidatus Kaiserbacteria bacterium RIFCSPHIGHO2_02_FULL_55_25]OGG77582.1 MAG: dihydroneopterin aldolase [Candidatus Kaiserbacteria bacterium RIFCSPHIGHO2_12_FULL_55_13]OGG83416.1 MAG: dihydroneopterin aldolase [Candidatus Kaiserbacteria bacterium RIFCSPLOWO2_01_FULL_55_25]